MTLQDAIFWSTTRLSEHEDLRADARRDAEFLLLHVLAASRTILFSSPERLLTERESEALRNMVERRATGEPIQYIVGEQEFYGLALNVDPAVLIPRPETETLVEAALARLPVDRPLRIADVGTGSGAIAIAMALHLPLAEVTALDLSPAALEVARANAIRHGLDNRIRFVESDLMDALGTEIEFDAVLSNPPYVPDRDRPTLHRQVRDHEPETALFAGADGLAIYRRLVPQAAAALAPGGLLAMEIGYGQREAITELLTGWQSAEFLRDLQGIDRVAIARPGAR